MKIKLTLIHIILFQFFGLFAQSKWGLELTASRLKTENAGQLIAYGTGYTYYVFSNEADPITFDFAVGLFYKLNPRNLVEIHFGSHLNGRIYDYTYYDDVGNTYFVHRQNEPFHFSQIGLSYNYRLINAKFIIPIEIGLNMNKWVEDVTLDYFEIHKINLDFQFRTGLQYCLSPSFLIGINGIYTRNINEYQRNGSFMGSYKPRQWGLGLSFLYDFSLNFKGEE